LRPLNIFIVEDKVAYPFQTEIPDGLKTLRASECGECHDEIYREWSQSIHARAWTDEYFQADKEFEGDPPVCKNCHIQLDRQREQRVVGFADSERLHPLTEANPDFDPQLRDEGVTCAVCHVRDGLVLGPFEIDDAPHKVKAAPELFSGKEPCQLCHLVSGNRWDMFYRKPPCGTLDEIEETGTSPDCVGCHLPRVSRPMAKGGPVRTGGKHLFHGGHNREKVKGALRVATRLSQKQAETRVDVTLTNIGTTHYLPTGTPDRHLSLELRVVDGNRQAIEEKTFILKRHVMWRPFIVDLWDDRLPFNQPRVFSWSFTLRADSAVATLEVVVRYHLLEEQRRRRIGYNNTKPIQYSIFEEAIPLNQSH